LQTTEKTEFPDIPEPEVLAFALEGDDEMGVLVQRGAARAKK
jgi:hypothetical protein